MHEWNEEECSIITTNNSRLHYLQSIEERIDWDIKRLQSIIKQLEYKRVKYTAEDIILKSATIIQYTIKGRFMSR